MPTRTIVEELCDVCYSENLQVVASDRLRFSWQGQDLLLLVCEDHVDPIRDEFERWSQLAAVEGGRHRSVPARKQSGAGRAAGDGSKVPTLFSQLDAEEKERFRAWADMPNARRIGDSRVAEWIEAGRP
jgi:hypothetical protein